MNDNSIVQYYGVMHPVVGLINNPSFSGTLTPVVAQLSKVLDAVQFTGAPEIS